MRKRIIPAAALAAAIATLLPGAARAGATRVENAIWANGELFGTVLTPTSFTAPPSQSVDVLYTFMMSGLTGQRSVSDAGPGDPDYNGGRWSVQAVVYTADGLAAFDPDGDGMANSELTSATDVLHYASLGLLAISPTGVYFECPLVPQRGQ